MAHYITAFFHFLPIPDPVRAERDIFEKASALGLQGLLILGPEGVNSTCSCESREKLQAFQQWIRSYLGDAPILFKDSMSDRPPFRRYKIKIREEIVTTGIPGLVPPPGNNHHLSPEEWNQVLEREPEAVLIDTRNWYEYEVGTFRGALNPDIEKFTDFPAYIEKQGISKDRKMLIFCTGGIRCEKGILELQQQGYRNVYQLEGGILNYLSRFPNDRFEGECFVFDHRVALDQNLAPSRRYGLCPHCGQPAETEIQCSRCDHRERICGDCLEVSGKQETCSKNCAHHWELRPGGRGRHQDSTDSRRPVPRVGGVTPPCSA